jgi:hypothetical protein
MYRVIAILSLLALVTGCASDPRRAGNMYGFNPGSNAQLGPVKTYDASYSGPRPKADVGPRKDAIAVIIDGDHTPVPPIDPVASIINDDAKFTKAMAFFPREDERLPFLGICDATCNRVSRLDAALARVQSGQVDKVILHGRYAAEDCRYVKQNGLECYAS